MPSPLVHQYTDMSMLSITRKGQSVVYGVCRLYWGILSIFRTEPFVLNNTYTRYYLEPRGKERGQGPGTGRGLMWESRLSNDRRGEYDGGKGKRRESVSVSLSHLIRSCRDASNPRSPIGRDHTSSIEGKIECMQFDNYTHNKHIFTIGRFYTTSMGK